MGGAGQTLGRTLYAALARRTTATARTTILIALGSLTAAVFAAIPGPYGLLIAMSIVAGMVRGNLTLLQATAITDRWGTTHYGRLSGLLAAPAHTAAALAPFAGAALAVPLGGYRPLFFLLAAVSVAAALIAPLVTMVIVQALGASGIEMGAKILAVFVLAEFSILIAFALVTLFKGGGHEGLGFTDSFSPSAALQGAPGVALMFAVASMFGFEATAIYGEEAREPRKTVPRATYLSVAVITGFFAFTSWMLISAHGASQATGDAGKALQSGDATSFVFAPIAALFGGWANDVLPILLATSLFAGILAFHNSANRYLFSLGREGLLPHALTAINRRHSPWVAGTAQTVLSVLLVMPFAILGKDPVLTLFSWFSGVAVLGIMLLYFLTSASIVVFFRRSRADTRPWNTLIAPVLGALGIAGAIWLIIANFTTLIGGDQTTAIWLQLTVPVVLILGVVAARLTRSRTQTAD
ncbi:APC family permease [Streptomyces scabiei]|uniref:APC family permease n=1 Tax=Streptomyces scabiei TaxID=1930 RepID=UPI0033C5BF08